jgi:hypothetical protein
MKVLGGFRMVVEKKKGRPGSNGDEGVREKP